MARFPLLPYWDSPEILTEKPGVQCRGPPQLSASHLLTTGHDKREDALRLAACRAHPIFWDVVHVRCTSKITALVRFSSQAAPDIIQVA